MKICLCCEREYDVAQWLELPKIGIQQGDKDTPSLELRNCGCGSTLAVELPPWRIRIDGDEIACNTKAIAQDAFKSAIAHLPRGVMVSLIAPSGFVLGSFSKGMPMEAQ